MRLAIAAFAFGVWLCQRLPELPSIDTMAAGSALWAVVAGAAGLAACRRGGPTRRAGLALACLLAVGAGLLWAGWRAEWRLAGELPMVWEGRDVAVTGVVVELPQALERGVRFVFEVEHADAPVPRRLQLSWYAERGGGQDAALPAVSAGERWCLRVRLKRPHGFVNPHGFDYEAWLLERGLRATGYVRTGDAGNARLAGFVPTPMNLVHRLRESVRARFLSTLGDAPYGGILVALAIGDQNAIPVVADNKVLRFPVLVTT